jgi:IS4 transposase
LPPIAYNSRNFCKKNNLEYKTENDCVVEYIEYLNIGEYIGEYNAEDIVVLADSGYDAKKIEEAICEKGWKFIIALKRTRSVRSKAQHARDPKSKNWFSVAELFRNYRRAKWQTVQLIVDGGKKKRMDFRIRQIIGNLKGVCHVQLICSEFKKRPDGRRKYLACNDLKVTAKQILIGYRLRWKIEIFHKEVKMFLGFQEVAAKNFNSVRSHVHWVYCAYILLHMIPELKDKPYLTLADRQKFVEEVYMKRNISGTLQLLSQFGGVAKYISQLRTALAETSIA